MGYGQHLKSGYPTRAGSSPPIPSPTNSVLIVSTWNWNPAAFSSASLSSNSGTEVWNPSTVAPYAIDWAAGIAQGAGPYLIDQWYDQTPTSNNLTQTGAARPSLDTTTVKSPLGAAGCGLVGVGTLIGSVVGTVYCSFKGNGNGFLVSTGDGTGKDSQILISLTGGTLTVDLYANSGSRQTKTKAVADSNWHWLAVKFDTTLAAANQLVIQIDDSTTGVVATNTQDLAGAGMATEPPSVFCKDAGGVPSNAYTGYMNTVYANSLADSATLRTSYFKRWQYLMSTIGVTV